MTLDALRMAAQAFRRNPYPFAATGVIALALNFLGLVHPMLSMISSLFMLPMLYVGLGTLAEAEPGLRFTQALRLALSAWPRMAALGSLMILLFLVFTLILGASLTALYGDQLLELAQTHEADPNGFAREALARVNWEQSSFGLAAMGLFLLGTSSLVWTAPFALVHHNLNVFSSIGWSIRASRMRFASMLPAVLLWLALSVASGALPGLHVVLWPITALFHFYCFRNLGKQAP